MIHFLSGALIEKSTDFCVIDVQGVGYGASISSITRESIGGVGEEVKLWTHLHVREMDMSLYGFATREERDAFEVIITASGIGPKVALAMLSTFPVDELASAIVSGDLRALSQCPGVGKRTAEKISIELRTKMAKFVSSDAGAGKTKGAKKTATPAGMRAEAVEALMSLGAPNAEARRRVEEAARQEGATESVEALVTAAMRIR